MLVGAVGIENINVRNFKDLRGTRGNAKSLKRNNKACTEFLLLKAPSDFLIFEIPTFNFCYPLHATNVGFRLKIRGADGEPTIRI
jgi:hypothetical protein